MILLFLITQPYDKYYYILFHNKFIFNRFQYMQIKRNQQIRYSSECHQKSAPDEGEAIYSHEDSTSIRHEIIRRKHLENDIHRYQEYIQQKMAKFDGYGKSFKENINKMRQQLDQLDQQIDERIKQNMEELQETMFNYEQDQMVRLSLKGNSFDSFTCHQMSRLVELTSNRSKKERSLKINQKIEDFAKELQSKLLSFINKFYPNNTISTIETKSIDKINFNQSAIVQRINQSFISEDSRELKEIVSNPPQKDNLQVNIKKNPFKKINKHQNDSYHIVEDEDEDNYYEHNQIQISKAKVQEVKQHNIEEKVQIVPSSKPEKIKEIERQNSIDKNQYKINEQKKQMNQSIESYINFQSEYYNEDNEQQIKNQTTKFQKQFTSDTPTKYEQDEYYNISDLDDLLQTEDPDKFLFSIRVCVVKVLYFSVLDDNIPKIKFAAGDQTGIGVFYTNYWMEIRPNCQLQLKNCSFYRFKNSVQIANHKRFIKINRLQDQVTPNLDGIRLGQLQQDLHYPVEDKRCMLIRQVCDRLRKVNKTTISKMVVKIVFIIKQFDKGVFAQIGDSSGLMFGAIKKQPMKNIKEGDVVKLFNCECIRGTFSIVKEQFKEEVFYVDSMPSRSTVSPYLQQFLKLSEEVMEI